MKRSGSLLFWKLKYLVNVLALSLSRFGFVADITHTSYTRVKTILSAPLWRYQEKWEFLQNRPGYTNETCICKGCCIHSCLRDQCMIPYIFYELYWYIIVSWRHVFLRAISLVFCCLWTKRRMIETKYALWAFLQSSLDLVSASYYGQRCS